MELRLDQELKKGVEAHKAGRTQEANRYYKAVLKAQPNHPDANHNMGVLAVGINKIEKALPFFKTALDSNPNIEQFWLSYIDALIKLNKMADANAIFNQAQSKGLKGEGFDQIEKKLSKIVKEKRDKPEKKILNKALDFKEKGKFDQAIDLLKKGTSQFPKDLNLLALLSQCYILNEDLEKAGIYLNRAKNINPEAASVRWNESRLLLKQKNVGEALAIAMKTHNSFPKDIEGMAVVGSCLRACGEFKESLIFLNKAIELDNQYAEAFIIRGLIYQAQKNKPKALEDLETGYHLKPHIKQIWDLLISLKIESKDYSSAIMILINMIEIDPNHKRSFELLAICNKKANDTVLAIKSFKKVLEISPNDATTRINLGIAFKQEGMTEKAIDEFEAVLSINPNSSEAHYHIGNALIKLGKLEEAIKAYKKALSIKPNYLEAQHNIGNALYKKGDLEEAIKIYNSILTIKPKNTEILNMIGLILKDQNKFEKAIEFFKKAININPNYAEIYYNIANTFKKQGKNDEAIDSYHKAILIKPNYDKAYSSIGITFMDQNNLEEAIKAFKKAIEFNPNQAGYHYNIGNALREQGKFEEAINSFKEAITIKPDYAEAIHMLSALTGKTTKTAPRSYVENLFDEYAKKFDDSLTKKLDYRIPKIITGILELEMQKSSLGSILDLGCGTGLTGKEIKKYCSYLEGIDLSNSMLDQAKLKNIYDKLSHVDIIEYLITEKLNFDYFISTDVFIYIGDLSEIFRLIKSRNKKFGKLVFTTEHKEGDSFYLEKSGRYSHSRDYIERLCNEFNYSISHFSKSKLRKEGEGFLASGIYILDF